MIDIRYFIIVILLTMYACSGKTNMQDKNITHDSINAKNDITKNAILIDTVNDSDVFSKIILPNSHTIIHGVNKNLPECMKGKSSTRKNSKLSLRTPKEINDILGEPIRISTKVYQQTDTIADLNLRTLLSKIKNPIIMEADYGDYNGSISKIYYLMENGKLKSFYCKYISIASGDSIRITKYVLIDQTDIPQNNN